MTSQIDIVDTQLHLGRGKIEATIGAMDALGIRSVLADEFWDVWDSPEPTHIQPGYRLANGAWRAASPTAEEAAIRYPDRFAYLLRIDRRDPQLESVMRVAASSPHARAFRLQPVWTLAEAAVFADGGYDALFAIAQDLGLPVCLFVPGYAELIAPYARRYPAQTFVVDHVGMGFANIPPDRPRSEADHTRSHAYFATVLALAELPNVILKWSHAQDCFDVRDYPYEPLRPLLRRAIDAFGADRLMWASDKTVMFGHTWSDLLDGIRRDPELSGAEKAAILGGTARRVLDWAVAPATEPRPGAPTGA